MLTYDNKWAAETIHHEEPVLSIAKIVYSKSLIAILIGN